MPIRIAIYEDNAALRDSLSVLLSGIEQFALVGAFGDCQNIEKEVPQLDPDVILMDIDMPGRSGIEGTFLAKKANPATEVLMLTVFDDNDKVFQAICAGASGYLLKKTPPSKILEAIEDIYKCPLLQTAVDTLNRQLKSGVSNEELAQLVVSLRADGRLCRVAEDGESTEPQVICSLGLREPEGNKI